MMDHDELLKHVSGLAQMDYDAVHVYDEALEHVDDAEVRRQFEIFRGEHQAHYTSLVGVIKQMDGTPPEPKVDMMGHVAEWTTSIRSMRGTEGALHAMRTAERYHNNKYRDAVGWEHDDNELKMVLLRFYDDEKKHLEYVESKVHAGAGTTTGY